MRFCYTARRRFVGAVFTALQTNYKAIIHAPTTAAPILTIGTPLLPLIPSDVVVFLVTVVEPPSIVVVVEPFLVVLPAFLIASRPSSIIIRVGTDAVIAEVRGPVYGMVVLATAAFISRAEHWFTDTAGTHRETLWPRC